MYSTGSNRWLLPLGCWSALLLLVLTTSALASGRPVGVAAAPVVRGAQQPRAQATPLPTGANLDVLLLLDNSANMTAADPSGARGQVAQYIARYMAAATLATADSHRLGVISFGGASADPQFIQNLTRAASIDPNANWLTGSPQTPGDFNAALTLARQQAETARREDAGRQPVVFLFTSGYTGADSVTYFNATRAEVETYQQENIPLFVVSTKTAAAVPPWAALAAATSSVGISVSGLQLDLTPASLTLVKTSVRNVLSALVPAVQLISAPAPAELKIAITEPLLDSLSIVIIKNAITDTAELQSDGVMVPPTDRTRDNQALIYSIANPDASIYNFQGTQGSVIGVVKRLPALDLVFGASQVEADTNLKVGLNIKTTRATSAVPIVATLVITNATKGVESQPLLLQPGPTSGVYSTTVLLHEGTYTVQATTGITTSSGSVVAVSRPSSVIRVVASRKPALGQFTVSGGPGITQTYQVLVPVINADTVLGQPVGAFLDQSIVFDPAQNAYPLRFSAPAGSIGTIITYTAQFTPTQLGTYSLVIRLRGITNAGLDFPVDGRFDKEIVAAPIPNPLAEALQWGTVLSVLALSLVGTVFFWRNRTLLPEVGKLRKQTELQSTQLQAEEVKRNQAIDAVKVQMEAQIAQEKINQDAEKAQREAQQKQVDASQQDVIQGLEGKVTIIQGKLEKEERKRQAADTAREAADTAREAADTAREAAEKKVKDFEKTFAEVTESAKQGLVTPNAAGKLLGDAYAGLIEGTDAVAEEITLKQTRPLFTAFLETTPGSVLQKTIAISGTALLANDRLIKPYTENFYKVVMNTMFSVLEPRHIMPFLYQWLIYYDTSIKGEQQQRESGLLKGPAFKNFLTVIIHLLHSDLSGEGISAEPINATSLEVTAFETKKLFLVLLESYADVLWMMPDDLHNVTLNQSKSLLSSIEGRFVTLTNYRFAAELTDTRYIELRNQLDDIQARIVTPLLQLAQPFVIDRYSALLPIHPEDLKILGAGGHLIESIGSYIAKQQASLALGTRLDPLLLLAPADSTPATELDGSTLSPATAIIVQQRDALTFNSLEILQRDFRTLYTALRELIPLNHEPWDTANGKIEQWIEECTVSDKPILAEHSFFLLALRRLQAYVTEYKRQNAAKHKFKLVAAIEPPIVMENNHTQPWSDNIYFITITNKGSAEILIRELYLTFKWKGKTVLELHALYAENSADRQPIRPGEKSQFTIRAGKDATKLPAHLFGQSKSKGQDEAAAVIQLAIQIRCKYENIFTPVQEDPVAIPLDPASSATAIYYHWEQAQQLPLSRYGDDPNNAAVPASRFVADVELRTYFVDYYAYDIEFAAKLRAACANQSILAGVISQGLIDFYQQQKHRYLVANDYADFELMLVEKQLVPRLWDATTEGAELLDTIYAFICNSDRDKRLRQMELFTQFAREENTESSIAAGSTTAQYTETQIVTALDQLNEVYCLIDLRGAFIVNRSSLMQGAVIKGKLRKSSPSKMVES